MKKLITSIAFIYMFFSINAQDKVWEVVLPQEKYARSVIYIDKSNPDFIYPFGEKIFHKINAEGKIITKHVIGRYNCLPYFLSSDSTVYTFLHGQTASIVFVSHAGQEKGVKTTILNKYPYNKLISLKIINGDLYALIGGFDYYNSRPLKSALVKIDKQLKVTETPIELPMMDLDKLVENKMDKNGHKYSSTWSEIYYDEKEHKSYIHRICDFNGRIQSSLFQFDFIKQTSTALTESQFPQVPADYNIYLSEVWPYKKNGENEFMLGLVLSAKGSLGLSKGLVDPQLWIARQSETGEIIEKAGISLNDIYSNVEDVSLRTSVAQIYFSLDYDPLENTFICNTPIGKVVFSEELKLKYVLHKGMSGAKIAKTYPEYSDSYEYTKLYHDRISEKKPASLMYSDDYVLLSYPDTSGNIVITKYKR